MRVELAMIFVLLSSMAAGAQGSFCAQVQALLKDPAVAQAHWGVSVTTLAGTPLCEIDEAQLFRPASNAKLFTIAAALAYPVPQGGGYGSADTEVAGKLDAETGIVSGDLSLLGGGDANLDSADLPYQPHRPAHPASLPDLEDLAAQLQAAGVTQVTGDIVGDDTLFPYEPYPQGWSTDDLAWGYGAPVAALTIADNQLRLTVSPAAVNSPAHVLLEQFGTMFYELRNEVRTTTAKLATGVQVERLPGSRTVRVFGSLAVESPPDAEQLAIDEPAAFAAAAFRVILLRRGVAVRGDARARHRRQENAAGFQARMKAPLDREQRLLAAGASVACAAPARGEILAVHHAPPRAQDIPFTLKTSQNLHAELLFHSLGLLLDCRDADGAAAARLVRAFLLKAGLKPDAFFLYDGSGLSTQDLITPRAATTLLAYAATQPWFESYRAALPVGGVDGTLAARFSSTLKGHVFAKTGTLGESRALSGYVTAASGQTLVFSILTDTHLPSTTADRAVTDKIVELVAAAN